MLYLYRRWSESNQIFRNFEDIQIKTYRINMHLKIHIFLGEVTLCFTLFWRFQTPNFSLSLLPYFFHFIQLFFFQLFFFFLRKYQSGFILEIFSIPRLLLNLLAISSLIYEFRHITLCLEVQESRKKNNFTFKEQILLELFSSLL